LHHSSKCVNGEKRAGVLKGGLADFSDLYRGLDRIPEREGWWGTNMKKKGTNLLKSNPRVKEKTRKQKGRRGKGNGRQTERN